MSLYHDALDRFLGLFGRASLQVLLFEELTESPGQACASVRSFLGAPADEAVASGDIHNASMPIRSNTLAHAFRLHGAVRRALRFLVPQPVRKKVHDRLAAKGVRYDFIPPMKEGTRTSLADVFREDILKTQALTGKDLSHWLT
jgi:hypothetical protein